jgi:hypothetical protein
MADIIEVILADHKRMRRMQDAIADHDDFRQEVREAGLHAADSALWWRAVASALWASSDHAAREQRAALAAFGRRAARRCAMSFAASGPRSSRPTPVTQHRKRESATAMPGEPRQVRPVTAPFTTHPADLAAAAEG